MSMKVTVLLTWAAALLAAGCANRGSHPRPGSGLADYRKIVVEVRNAAAASNDALDGIENVSTQGAAKSVERFDRALEKFEVISIRARAKADAMEARGTAYFDEWQQKITTATNAVARQQEQARENELRQHFERILARSRQAREIFRPYLGGQRELRAALVKEPTVAKIKASQGKIVELRNGASRLDRAFDDLLREVDSAAAVVKDGRPLPQRAGGQQ